MSWMLAIAQNPNAQTSLRVLMAVAHLEGGQPKAVADVASAPVGSVKNALARMVDQGVLRRDDGVYSLAGAVTKTCRSHENVTVEGHDSVTPSRFRDCDRHDSVTGTPAATRAQDSSQKRSTTYPPTSLPSGQGDQAGWLAGQDPRQGDPSPGSDPDGTLAAAEALELRMQAATAQRNPGPAGWFDEICREIGDRMPARRGRGNVRIEALTQTHRKRLAAIIREHGGHEVFDAVIRPAMLEASEITSPAGFISYLYGQHSAGSLQARPIRDLPPFVSLGLVEVYEGNVRDCCVAEASSIVGSNNPHRPHYHSAIGWLAQRAAEPDIAPIVHRNHWQFDAPTLGKAMTTLENHGN